MKSVLFLILSLTAGSEASSEMKGCVDGWIDFTCGYSNTQITKHHVIDVVTPKETVRSSQTDEWEKKGRVFLFHDTRNKNLRVIIKPLEKEDFGKHKCVFHTDTVSAANTTEMELDLDDDCNHTQSTQTVHTTTKTTMTCGDTGNRSGIFCKENGFICEDILSSTLKSNGTFSLTDTYSGFSVSISDVSSQDAGVYWCGVKPAGGNYRTALRSIKLEVHNVAVHKMSSAVGRTLTYWCSYSEDAPTNKFICAGEDPAVCQQLVNSSQTNVETGKFSMKDDRKQRNITVTVRDLTTDDTGTYWCGAETADENRGLRLFNKLLLTVDPVTSSTTATTAGPSNESTTPSAETHVRYWLPAIIFGAVLIVLIMVLVYKCKSSKIRNTDRARDHKEFHEYAEIQAPPPKTDSGAAMKSIYVMATNPCASETACESCSDELHANIYSTVMFNDQRFTNAPVNSPPPRTEDPLYYTINLPQTEPPAEQAKVESRKVTSNFQVPPPET
ncbi:hypothetical protein Q5P01_001120 [Channa striata]|uniref:Immunoglobulin domain-containing protein n=1 Tax=Channa striata TaxID=64152 RepID=A0AA88T3M4_CHASR|nr:hypothetical protein Q5P01_001120 [Channa striata]